MSTLKRFVKFEDVKTKSKTAQNVTIIDGHNIAYITVFSTIMSDYSDNGVFKLWKHSFLTKTFATINDLKSDMVVLAFDTKGSWRYDIYDEYKGNRKQQYGRYPLDKKGFMVALNEMIQIMESQFTQIRTIRGTQCEGDDIIAVLCREVFNHPRYKVTVASGDHDMNQLLSQKNVRQYDPRKCKYFEVLNPKLELKIKILSGDKSDNIFPIKRGVGPKTAAKILSSEEGVDGFINSQKTEEDMKMVTENYERNQKLINFDLIPQEIQSRVLDAYKNFEHKPINGKSVYKFLTKNKMLDLAGRWHTISKYLMKLN